VTSRRSRTGSLAAGGAGMVGVDGFAPAAGEDSLGTPVDFSRSRETL